MCDFKTVLKLTLPPCTAHRFEIKGSEYFLTLTFVKKEMYSDPIIVGYLNNPGSLTL